MLDETGKITGIDISMDTAAMRKQGDAMTMDEFSEERFDRVFELMRVKSNAENIRNTLSQLYHKNESLDGELTMIVTVEGISFEGVENWLSQIYAKIIPDRAKEAREAAITHLANTDKLAEIMTFVKSMFWRNTFRTFIEEAES